MAKNMVTIPLEEYKELLLKEKPTDKDREILKKIFDIIEPNLKYVERNYRYDNDVMKNVCIEDSNKLFVEIFTMLKYVDLDKYMSVWNMVMTNERKRKDQDELLKQMNDAKDIRREEN